MAGATTPRTSETHDPIPEYHSGILFLVSRRDGKNYLPFNRLESKRKLNRKIIFTLRWNFKDLVEDSTKANSKTGEEYEVRKENLKFHLCQNVPPVTTIPTRVDEGYIWGETIRLSSKLY